MVFTDRQFKDHIRRWFSAVALIYAAKLCACSRLSRNADLQKCYDNYTVVYKHIFYKEAADCQRTVSERYRGKPINLDDVGEVSRLLGQLFQSIVCFVKLFKSKCGKMDASLINAVYGVACGKIKDTYDFYQIMQCSLNAQTRPKELSYAWQFVIDSAEMGKRLDYGQCASSIKNAKQRISLYSLVLLQIGASFYPKDKYLSKDFMVMWYYLCTSGDLSCIGIEQMFSDTAVDYTVQQKQRICKAVAERLLQCNTDKKYSKWTRLETMKLNCILQYPSTPTLGSVVNSHRNQTTQAVHEGTSRPKKESGIPVEKTILIAVPVTILSLTAAVMLVRQWLRRRRLNQNYKYHPITQMGCRYSRGRLPEAPSSYENLYDFPYCNTRSINQYLEVLDDIHVHAQEGGLVRRWQSEKQLLIRQNKTTDNLNGRKKCKSLNDLADTCTCTTVLQFDNFGIIPEC